MIIKILGIFDIFIALCFWVFGIFGWIPESFIFLIGLFLLVKGIVFITGLSVTSMLDIVSAILIITSASFELPKIVVIIVALFLLQKGAFSLMS